MKRNFKKIMFLMIVTVIVLSISSCSPMTSELTSDFEDAAVSMVNKDNGASHPMSEDDSHYIATLIENAEKTIPDVWKVHFDYEFVLKGTTWLYCSENGGFSNLAENKSFEISESERVRLSEIIAETFNPESINSDG